MVHVEDGDSGIRPVLQSLSSMTCRDGRENHHPDDPGILRFHVQAFIGSGNGFVDLGSTSVAVYSRVVLASPVPEGDGQVSRLARTRLMSTG